MTCPHSTHEATWKGPCYSTSKWRPCWSAGILGSLNWIKTFTLLMLSHRGSWQWRSSQRFVLQCSSSAAVEDILHGNVNQFKHDHWNNVQFLPGTSMMSMRSKQANFCSGILGTLLLNMNMWHVHTACMSPEVLCYSASNAITRLKNSWELWIFMMLKQATNFALEYLVHFCSQRATRGQSTSSATKV